MRGHHDHEGATAEIAEKVKNSAYEIIQRKGATYYGIAMSVKRICEAIIRDERSILPISTMMDGEYGIKDVVLSSDNGFFVTTAYFNALITCNKFRMFLRFD